MLSLKWKRKEGKILFIRINLSPRLYEGAGCLHDDKYSTQCRAVRSSKIWFLAVQNLLLGCVCAVWNHRAVYQSNVCYISADYYPEYITAKVGLKSRSEYLGTVCLPTACLPLMSTLSHTYPRMPCGSVSLEPHRLVARNILPQARSASGSPTFIPTCPEYVTPTRP